MKPIMLKIVYLYIKEFNNSNKLTTMLTMRNTLLLYDYCFEKWKYSINSKTLLPVKMQPETLITIYAIMWKTESPVTFVCETSIYALTST